MENLKSLPPMDRLRYHLTENAKKASDPEAVKKWPARPSNAVANGIPYMIGLFGSLDSNDAGLGKRVKNALEQRAKDYGLASIDELRSAIVDLRSQLKQELSQDEWNGYFGRTEDFA